MMSIKFFLLLVVAVACVLALPAEVRDKKQVLLGTYGYTAYPAVAAPALAAPLAYSAALPAAYAAPLAYY